MLLITADNDRTESLLVDSLYRLVENVGTAEARTGRAAPRRLLPPPQRHVPAHRAVGRVAAETVSPYPPGVPVIAPGEVIARAAVAHMTSGVAVGILVPDAADPTAEILRVTARQRSNPSTAQDQPPIAVVPPEPMVAAPVSGPSLLPG